MEIEELVKIFRLVRDDMQKAWWVEAHTNKGIYRIAKESDSKLGEEKAAAQLILSQITSALRVGSEEKT